MRNEVNFSNDKLSGSGISLADMSCFCSQFGGLQEWGVSSPYSKKLPFTALAE